MAKKNFSGGLSALLGEPVAAHPESIPTPPAEVASDKAPVKSAQVGTKEGEMRATFIVKESALEKLKAIAYWDRLQIKDVVGAALAEYVAAYEKANGPVKSIPTR